jgi:hypothetical protein
MRSPHDININNGELINWLKHDGSKTCPTSHDAVIEVETWQSTGNVKTLASNLEWGCVKFYRVIEPKK